MDGTELMSGDTLGWLLSLASNPVALGLFVFGLVATVKRSVDGKYELELSQGKNPKPVRARTWRALAFAVGLVASLVLHAATGRATFGGGWIGTVAFGLVAGLISIVGRDGLKTVLSWFGLAAASVPVVAVPVAAEATPGTMTAPLPPGPPEPEDLRPASAEDVVRMTGTALPEVELDRPLPDFLRDDVLLDTGGSGRDV